MAVRVWNQTIDPHQKMAGTLTCVLRLANSPQRWVAVSAAHVVAPLVENPTPGPSSGNEIMFEAGATAVTGKLWYWCDLQRDIDGFTNELDAALVEISAADAKTLLDALGQPGNWADAAAGNPVTFDGVTSGVMSGSFDGHHTTATLHYGVLGGTFAGVSFRYSMRANLLAQPGDSGALLTSGGKAVGLLVGSEGEQSRFLPLAPLLKSFGLEWPTDANAPLAALPAPPQALPAAFTGSNTALAADTLARTLWGESRSEPLRGIRAVAAVILNRAMHKRIKWWGRTVIGVCRAPWQFSCWNANDPNLPKLLAVTTANSRFQVCVDVAKEALAGQLSSEQTLNATHYHTKVIRPSWARNRVPCADIGAHLFYNDIE